MRERVELEGKSGAREREDESRGERVERENVRVERGRE